MTFVPFLTSIKVGLNFQSIGVPMVNTLLFNCGETPSTAKLTGLITVIDEWAAEFLPGGYSNQTYLVAIEARDMSEQAGLYEKFVLSAPLQGTEVSPAAPANVAVVASWRTGHSGRSYRGRNYIGGIPINSYEGNTVDPDYVAGWIGAYTALISAAAAEDYTWVVGSAYHNNAPREAGIVTPITNVLVDNRVDTQRRRLPKAG